MQKAICAKVLSIKCGDCIGKFHKADFSADEDTEFAGHYSLSCSNCGGVLVFVADENIERQGEEGIKRYAENKFRNCNCGGRYIFSFTKITEQNIDVPKDISFSEFRKLYKAPIVKHSCIFCNSFNTIIVNAVKPENFKKKYTLEYSKD